MNFNEDRLSESRKELQASADFQKRINVNLTDTQVDDLKYAIVRGVVQVTTEGLRRITTGKDYLTREQARKYLSVSDDVLQNWIEKEGMPYMDVDGIIRFYRVDLDAWLAHFVVTPNKLLDMETDPYWQSYTDI